MKFSNPSADVFIPEAGLSAQAALQRTTHLCIAAHQDDIEIFAYHGIAECFAKKDKWFSGVVVNNGAGSPRSGPYGQMSDEEMVAVRRQEQRKAAYVGEYSIQVQLNHPSSVIKDPDSADVRADIEQIVEEAAADTVYLHNPADKHDTHVAVFWHSLQALRALPTDKRPRRVLGGEVWRSLDWMLDEDKAVLPVDAAPNISASLLGVFDSQISGGKRYDLASAGRRLANATYFAALETDQSQALSWAIDLTPLVHNPSLSIEAFTLDLIDRFRDDVQKRLKTFTK